jgi:hypothetical protein
MFSDYVCRQSGITGRDILNRIMDHDNRFQRIPIQEDAERIAGDLNRERGMYIDPVYLLSVWQERFKA